MNKIVIFGAPGSGKGTQAERLAKKYNLEHISTGELLRQAVAEKNLAGRLIEKTMNSGRLVPDDLVTELVLEKLKQLKKKNKGFILDGYPRNLTQAKALAVVKLDFVFLIDISAAESLRRIASRQVCACGAVYNSITNPPQVANVCDKCQTKLKRRDDEDENTVKERLAVFHQQTDPVIDYYQAKGMLHKVDGEQAIVTVAADLNKIIEKFSK